MQTNRYISIYQYLHPHGGINTPQKRWTTQELTHRLFDHLTKAFDSLLAKIITLQWHIIVFFFSFFSSVIVFFRMMNASLTCHRSSLRIAVHTSNRRDKHLYLYSIKGKGRVLESNWGPFFHFKAIFGYWSWSGSQRKWEK